MNTPEVERRITQLVEQVDAVRASNASYEEKQARIAEIESQIRAITGQRHIVGTLKIG